MEFCRILVPVVGNKADEESIRLACYLARENRAKICAVYIIAVKRQLPLDAEIEPEIRRAEGILDRMDSVAGKQDYEIDTDLLQAREVGPAIVDNAAEGNYDLILMGVQNRTRFGQFSVGNVVPYVLKKAPCRVMLCHQPATKNAFFGDYTKAKGYGLPEDLSIKRGDHVASRTLYKVSRIFPWKH